MLDLKVSELAQPSAGFFQAAHCLSQKPFGKERPTGVVERGAKASQTRPLLPRDQLVPWDTPERAVCCDIGWETCVDTAPQVETRPPKCALVEVDLDPYFSPRSDDAGQHLMQDPHGPHQIPVIQVPAPPCQVLPDAFHSPISRQGEEQGTKWVTLLPPLLA